MNTKIEINVDEDRRDAGERLQALIAVTNKNNPKPEDLAALRKLFDEAPHFAFEIGNSQKVVFTSILSALVGSSSIRREAADVYIKKLKDDLGYQTSSFVEKMLIDEVAMRWLRHQLIESLVFQKTQTNHSLKEGEHWANYWTHRRRDIYARMKHSPKCARIARTQADGARMFKDLLTTDESKQGNNDT